MPVSNPGIIASDLVGGTLPVLDESDNVIVFNDGSIKRFHDGYQNLYQDPILPFQWDVAKSNVATPDAQQTVGVPYLSPRFLMSNTELRSVYGNKLYFEFRIDQFSNTGPPTPITTNSVPSLGEHLLIGFFPWNGTDPSVTGEPPWGDVYGGAAAPVAAFHHSHSAGSDCFLYENLEASYSTASSPSQYYRRSFVGPSSSNTINYNRTYMYALHIDEDNDQVHFYRGVGGSWQGDAPNGGDGLVIDRQNNGGNDAWTSDLELYIGMRFQSSSTPQDFNMRLTLYGSDEFPFNYTVPTGYNVPV